jgi:hypothetical protein
MIFQCLEELDLLKNKDKDVIHDLYIQIIINEDS